MRIPSGFMWTVFIATCVSTATVGHAAPLAYAIRQVEGGPQVLVSLDLGTGVSTTIGTLTGITGEVRTLALSPSGLLFTSSLGASPGLYSVDSSTGAATLVGLLGCDCRDLDFSGTSLQGSDLFSIYDIDTATAGTTVIGSGSTFQFSGFAAIDASTAYVSFPGNNASLGLLDHLNATVTTIGPIGSSSLDGLDIASDGNLYGLRFEGEVLRINTSTGVGTVIFQASGGWRALAAIPDQGVPEPATIVEVGLALSLLLAWKQRR